MIKLYFLLLLFTISSVTNAQQQWSWIGGDKSPNAIGIYGSKGVAQPQNFPGSRAGANTWTDKEGNMWLFGGTGKDADGRTGYLNDLWKFDPASKQWTWISGANTVNKHGLYGNKLVASPTNQPGARQNALCWTDAQGNFWLFGGMGMAASIDDVPGEEKPEKEDPEKGKPDKDKPGKDKDKDEKEKKEKEKRDKEEKEKKEKEKKDREDKEKGKDNDKKGDDSNLDEQSKSAEGLLNDLWVYSPATGNWTWISGSSSINQKSTNVNPGSRYLSAGWIDGANNLYLFGGRGYSTTSGNNDMNDLWKFSSNAQAWSLLKDNEPGTNAPTGRRGATSWVDNNGKFWLFGGATGSDHWGDLWKFDPNNSEWTSVKGANEKNTEPSFSEQGAPSDNANPGARMVAAGWTDNENNLFVFGGKGYGSGSQSKPLNNMWKYSVATNQWTFIKGESSTSPAPVFGTRGSAAEKNNPGGTADAAIWKLPDGTVYIFGGYTADAYTNFLWKLAGCTTQSVAGKVQPASATICQNGSQLLTATGGSSFSWKRNGEALNGQTMPTLRVTQPGTYTAVIANGACSSPASVSATVTVADTASGVRYADVNATANVPVQLTARNVGFAYSWTPATGLDNINSNTPYATVSADQNYLVYITGERGCITTDTLLVKIDIIKIQKIAVPTAFTPNGNGSNDVLRPLGELSSLDYFRVFNRWGKMLYQTSTVGQGWDGRFSGTIQPTETYTWILSGKSTDGQPVKLSGKTVLIR